MATVTDGDSLPAPFPRTFTLRQRQQKGLCGHPSATPAHELSDCHAARDLMQPSKSSASTKYQNQKGTSSVLRSQKPSIDESFGFELSEVIFFLNVCMPFLSPCFFFQLPQPIPADVGSNMSVNTGIQQWAGERAANMHLKKWLSKSYEVTTSNIILFHFFFKQNLFLFFFFDR